MQPAAKHASHRPSRAKVSFTAPSHVQAKATSLQPRHAQVTAVYNTPQCLHGGGVSV